jgi:hypothetical protein
VSGTMIDTPTDTTTFTTDVENKAVNLGQWHNMNMNMKILLGVLIFSLQFIVPDIQLSGLLVRLLFI